MPYEPSAPPSDWVISRVNPFPPSLRKITSIVITQETSNTFICNGEIIGDESKQIIAPAKK